MRRKKIVPCLFLTVALCGCTTQTVEDAKQIEESKTYVSKYEYETDTDGKTETQAYSEEKPTFTDWETVTGITDPAVDYKEGTVKYKSMNEEFSMGAYEYSVTEAVITKDVILTAGEERDYWFLFSITKYNPQTNVWYMCGTLGNDCNTNSIKHYSGNLIELKIEDKTER